MISPMSARARPRPRNSRMHEHAHTAHVPFPAAELLVQRGVADDFAAHQPDQRQIAPVVKVPAPVADGFDFRDAMFDEHPFLFGDAEKQPVEFFFVIGAQGAQRCFRAVFERNDLGELLEFKFNAK